MTAETQLPDELEIAPVADLSPFAVTLVVIALAAAGGWLHTVHELNRLLARELVPGAVLRELQALQGAPPASVLAERQRQSRADD
jgi:hypothetical protein